MTSARWSLCLLSEVRKGESKMNMIQYYKEKGYNDIAESQINRITGCIALSKLNPKEINELIDFMVALEEYLQDEN